jgi:ribosomal protein S18 acetylase RimI-like enzyme
MECAIRPAMPADAPGVASVARLTWNATYAQSIASHNRQHFLDQAYSPGAMQEAINNERGWFYVATQVKRVIGFAQFLRRFDRQGELVRIYVHPAYQRQGIGRAFLATGLLAMASASITQCYVSVEVSNRAARAFYERFGFREHREYGRFLGDQIIRLLEYSVRIANLLDTPAMQETIRKMKEQT